MVNPELWVLESAATSLMPLWAVIHPQIEQLLNIPSHGLKRAPLLDLLERLVWRGDLFMEDENDHPQLFTASAMDSLAQRDRHCPHYGLTAKGGARWESWAGADWNRYVDCGQRSTTGEDLHYEISTVNRATLERFIEVYFPYFGRAIVPGTESWDFLAPWPATYWRVLPSAWRFQCRESQRPGGEEYARRPDYEKLTRWHRHAWEAPESRI